MYYKKGFTLIELVVVITILSIIGTIGFTTFHKNVSSARDSQRISDLSKVKSAMRLYKQQKGLYPVPGDTFSILLGTTVLGYQGQLNTKVALSSLDTLPKDPIRDIPYLYSVTTNSREMQVAGTIENGGKPKALILGDYKTVSVNILPTIMIASTGDIDVASDNTKFIFDGTIHNLPYNFESSRIPTSDGTSLSSLIAEAQNNNFWQNTSYRTCLEIKEAGKSIGDGEYQVLTTSGSLSNTGCTSM